MKKHGCGWQRKASTGCEKPQAIQTVQPFPHAGVLADHTNVPKPCLSARLQGIQGLAYSYVLRTVKLDRDTTCFEQYGSAPNFQGGLLTLCTCKHQMRASQPAAAWENNVWIAGFTSRRIHEGKHWLFYLMKVDQAFESQSDLWDGMASKVRSAKAARKNYLGDVFEPKRPGLTGDIRYSPSRYYTPPIHAHRQRPGGTGWHNDIDYRHADRHNRQPPLLVGDPHLTFLWEEPIIFLSHDHCRDYFKWASLQELIAELKEARP